MLHFFFDTLHVLLGSGIVYHGVLGIAILLLMLFAGKIFKYFLNTIGRRIISATENDLDDKILEIILARTIGVFGICGMYLGIHELRNGVATANTSVHQVLNISNTILFVLAAIVITTVIVRITHTVVSHMFASLAVRGKNFNQALTPLVNRVATFVVASFSAIVVMNYFGYPATSVLTLLGGGAFAVGFAAQDTLSNMISGFVIIIDRPFRVGDRIKLPTNEEGDVFEIGLRSTKILDFDNNLLIIPNNDLVKTRIVNYSYPADEILVDVEVNIAYGEDVEKVKELLFSIIHSHSEVLREPAPNVVLLKLGDWGLQFKVIGRVNSYKIKSRVGEELRAQIYTALNKANIRIAVPLRALS